MIFLLEKKLNHSRSAKPKMSGLNLSGAVNCYGVLKQRGLKHRD